MYPVWNLQDNGSDKGVSDLLAFMNIMENL